MEVFDVQRVERKRIMMGAVTMRRTRPSITQFPEIIDALSHRSIFVPITAPKVAPGGRNIESRPVIPNSRWCIGIAADQGETARSSRRVGPGERRKEILAVASETRWDFAILIECGAGQSHFKILIHPTAGRFDSDQRLFGNNRVNIALRLADRQIGTFVQTVGYSGN